MTLDLLNKTEGHFIELAGSNMVYLTFFDWVARIPFEPSSFIPFF